MRLGSVRVSEAFLDGEKTTGKQIKALREHAERSEWWAGGEGGRLAGIGGTIRNLAAAAQKRLELPDVDVQGFELTRDVLEELSSCWRPSRSRNAARCRASSRTAAT